MWKDIFWCAVGFIAGYVVNELYPGTVQKVKGWVTNLLTKKP